jgi:hypothetical protein
VRCKDLFPITKFKKKSQKTSINRITTTKTNTTDDATTADSGSSSFSSYRDPLCSFQQQHNLAGIERFPLLLGIDRPWKKIVAQRSICAIIRTTGMLSYTENSAINRLEERQQQANEENGDNCVLYLCAVYHSRSFG